MAETVPEGSSSRSEPGRGREMDDGNLEEMDLMPLETAAGKGLPAEVEVEGAEEAEEERMFSTIEVLLLARGG